MKRCPRKRDCGCAHGIFQEARGQEGKEGMIHMTKPAVEKLRGLLVEHPDDPIVRLAVRDKDDKTLVFSITLEHATKSEDTVFEIQGLTIAIDGSSTRRVEGLTVDYQEPEGFRFRHPDPTNPLTLNPISLN